MKKERRITMADLRLLAHALLESEVTRKWSASFGLIEHLKLFRDLLKTMPIWQELVIQYDDSGEPVSYKRRTLKPEDPLYRIDSKSQR